MEQFQCGVCNKWFLEEFELNRGEDMDLCNSCKEEALREIKKDASLNISMNAINNKTLEN